jgi:hypothetical protein
MARQPRRDEIRLLKLICCIAAAAAAAEHCRLIAGLSRLSAVDIPHEHCTRSYVKSAELCRFVSPVAKAH